MNKKFVSIAAAAAMTVSAFSTSIISAETNPTVIVNGRNIIFADQQPVIVDDRTLVPARGVFEALGASVEWVEDERKVIVRSSDNITRIDLVIDDATMNVYTFTSITTNDREDITLDVAPQIINDRTMVPLRAISEALDTTVSWDDSTKTVTITDATYESVNTSADTDDTTATEATSDADDSDAAEAPSETVSSELPEMSVSVDSSECSVGDEVKVYVDVHNVTDEMGSINAYVAVVNYDPDKFEHVLTTFLDVNGDDLAAGTFIGGDNPQYLDDASACKIAYVELTENSVAKDGHLAVLTFKATAAGEAEFALRNAFSTDHGYDTYFTIERTSYRDSDELKVVTDPVSVTVNE